MIKEAILYATDYLLGIRTVEENKVKNAYNDIIYYIHCTSELEDYFVEYAKKRIDNGIYKESKVHRSILYWAKERDYDQTILTKEMLDEINKRLILVDSYVNETCHNQMTYDTNSETMEWTGPIDTNVIDFWLIDKKRPHFRTKDTLYRIVVENVTTEDKKAMLLYMFLNNMNDIRYICFFNPFKEKEERYKITECDLYLKAVYRMAVILKKLYQMQIISVGQKKKKSTYVYQCPCKRGKIEIGLSDLAYEIQCDKCKNKYRIRELNSWKNWRLEVNDGTIGI